MGRDGMDLGVRRIVQDESHRRGSDTSTAIVLRAGGGAAVAIGIAGAVGASLGSMLALAPFGAILGLLIPRLLSGHTVFPKAGRKLG